MVLLVPWERQREGGREWWVGGEEGKGEELISRLTIGKLRGKARGKYLLILGGGRETRGHTLAECA